MRQLAGIIERRPCDSALCLLSSVGPQINQRARRAPMADMVLNRVQVVSFLPKQNADTVFENMVVPLCRVNAGKGRISLDDDIHVLAGPGKQFGVRVRPGKFEQWRLIEQDITINSESVQRRSALLQPFDRELAVADVTPANRQRL